jgi:polyferredoxin
MMKKLPIATLRTLVQAGFTLFCLFAGYQFYHFYLWAMGKSQIYVPRPPSVEGFLPISALLGLKRLVLTGHYDEVHPAGLTIFLAALIIALLLRKGFCGWICPVGFVSNMLEKVGKKIRFIHHLPAWLDYPLLSLKYLLLAFFCYVILWQMDIREVEAFIHSPYNKIVDGKMLLFFLEPSSLVVKVMIFLIVTSLALRNFWCRYLCPYGALLGLLSLFSPFKIRREEEQCVNCRKCDKVCPASIKISQKGTVRNAECIGCMECVEVCPQEGCLTLSVLKAKKTPTYFLPAAVLMIFFFFWAVAVLTGHWHTSISPAAARQIYPLSSSLAHP